jgi:hypothetical protein
VGVLKKSDLDWKPVREGSFDGSLSYLAAQLPDGYEIEIGLEQNEDGVLQCTSFRLEPIKGKKSPDSSINSRYFQLLGFGDVLISARKAYGEWREVIEEVYEEIEIERLLEIWKSQGPTAIDDKYYAAIAWKYEQALLLGLENPITYLSESLKENRATISSRIVEARNRGLLSRPKYGSFGGRLTAKGKKALGITEVKSAKKGK